MGADTWGMLRVCVQAPEWMEPWLDRFYPRYLLLDESLEIIDLAERVYLWPCNCRSMLGRCSKPVFTCLRPVRQRLP